ncbi:uncharacterized protein F4822DRAFT_108847 [Hypoxylon trugodes]|uniref:uncharacterized protein n=1 Tax=Hypoxylon trugodes TaxID=326681 RepID=UPI00219FEE8B|nr:uncharacterized protein F4822DRAFT_108847 [Hypoxylon trugodes]KAI1391891.1 hypothetical protein F4822DRAFT_108847 [Hypoxylon trugodes]
MSGLSGCSPPQIEAQLGYDKNLSRQRCLQRAGSNRRKELEGSVLPGSRESLSDRKGKGGDGDKACNTGNAWQIDVDGVDGSTGIIKAHEICARLGTVTYGSRRISVVFLFTKDRPEPSLANWSSLSSSKKRSWCPKFGISKWTENLIEYVGENCDKNGSGIVSCHETSGYRPFMDSSDAICPNQVFRNGWPIANQGNINTLLMNKRVSRVSS